MNGLARADSYLTVPPRYGADLGGLWWSSNRDAVERRDGTTLAGADELRAVLDGVFAAPPAPPFMFVLNLLHLMKAGPSGFETLHAAFVGTRGAVSRARNVGLLVAELCNGLPTDGEPVTAADLSTALRTFRLYGEQPRPGPAAEPPLTRTEFESHVSRRLRSFTGSDLAHWLTHGCRPSTAGGPLAKEVEPLPVRVAKLLALARRRERLAGSAALAPSLDAALALPPRGRPPEALPVGGYCDVTTRGEPERLLPGQFALDPDEFVRRFAAHELLYFKREEPHEALRPERVIVLDQGVRTWGRVRHALTSAAVSLAGRGAKGCARVSLYLTSSAARIDLAEADFERVADQLEASDLTPNPNAALVLALHEPGPEAAPRDVILLTHARSARDPATYAGGTCGDGDRVFAVAVDESGAVELGEWAGGAFTSLRSFRVDLEAAEAAKPEEARPHPGPRPSPANPGGWTGDVEPVPFPFRPGLVCEPLQMGFDTGGECLAIVGWNGMVHALALDGTLPEVLPRAHRGGVTLRHVDAVVGVNGGVVLCGRMVQGGEPTVTAAAGRTVTPSSHEVAPASGASEPDVVEQFAAAHYDWSARQVTLHLLGRATAGATWTAQPDLHCVAVRTPEGAGNAVDLATGGLFPDNTRLTEALVSRARLAWARRQQPQSPCDVSIQVSQPEPGSEAGAAPFLLRVNPYVYHLQQAHTTWQAMCPLDDGKPLFDDPAFHRAQLAGSVLALGYTSAGKRRLLLLRGPDGTVLGNVTYPVRSIFTLSPNGQRLARRGADRSVTVSDTSDPARTVAAAAQAALHDALAAEIAYGPLDLTIIIGCYRHHFQLDGGELKYKVRWGPGEPATGEPAESVRLSPEAGEPARFPPHLVRHNRQARWRAVVDRFGQVLLYNEDGRLAAAFLVRRERAAAWAPGGVFWGDARLIGSPATPDAARRIGLALLAAHGD
ncbi:hypothetical protein R5W24_005053 [Gemmata sp. JC717]|uniref:hypothetical protein n=1 Tax=Gemmata algarum TaxID=2975278 RepID=UPI0021BB53E6|nr:hypothetical protein [Gemmata algarum]MDY3555907.1 hypothetical protein [Gemmata algarum]